MIMKTIKFTADGKMLPKCGPTSDVIVNGYLKSSTQVEIFGSSTETLLEYKSLQFAHEMKRNLSALCNITAAWCIIL